MSEENEKKDKKIVKVILTIIAILMIIAGSVWFGMYLFEQFGGGTADPVETTVAQQTTQDTTEKVLVDNPIDFDSLHEQNEEIYAWLKVPGTKVDYPLCQSSVADDFYLKHDAYTKQWLASGGIYIQSMNTKSFNDRVTVIYGHNGYSDTMFTTLHMFEKQDFFDEYTEFIIYTPNSKLTYQIVSAFKYDDRHILNSFDFQNDEIFEQFIAMIQNPESSNKKVRSTLDKEITINDNIVILSTCITNQPNSRFLVCGVKVKDEATN